MTKYTAICDLESFLKEKGVVALVVSYDGEKKRWRANGRTQHGLGPIGYGETMTDAILGLAALLDVTS